MVLEEQMQCGCGGSIIGFTIHLMAKIHLSLIGSAWQLLSGSGKRVHQTRKRRQSHTEVVVCFLRDAIRD